ncbi:hypothetical protein SLEP1_g51812 [Rubroshorea leprosula]|uniref:Uncharacterized protein n=1 Tax=Rubroshorea leprosula TaxID=152421 RepID=A0AAV5M703_9ROSI|nr:hypothetical protein SLEP1_g51812 [Rubroshorea leprosula]
MDIIGKGKRMENWQRKVIRSSRLEVLMFCIATMPLGKRTKIFKDVVIQCPKSQSKEHNLELIDKTGTAKCCLETWMYYIICLFFYVMNWGDKDVPVCQVPDLCYISSHSLILGRMEDFSCVKKTEGEIPHSQVIEKIMFNSEIDGSLSSGSRPNNCLEPSENTDRYLDSAQPLERENAQSEVSENTDMCLNGAQALECENAQSGVPLCCHAPIHEAGRVPFCVMSRNRLACNEVREFEYRVSQPQDINAAENFSDSANAILFSRFDKILSLGSSFTNSVSSSLEVVSQEQVPPKTLKGKLRQWLLKKVAEGGYASSILDEGGQGVLHLAAALGYDWALEPTIVAGVRVDFCDVNGWSALHWAASCGRGNTVATLISLGADPGALTKQSPEYPSCRTPADLASANGHKRIDVYLGKRPLAAIWEVWRMKAEFMPREAEFKRRQAEFMQRQAEFMLKEAEFEAFLKAQNLSKKMKEDEEEDEGPDNEGRRAGEGRGTGEGERRGKETSTRLCFGEWKGTQDFEGIFSMHGSVDRILRCAKHGDNPNACIGMC